MLDIKYNDNEIINIYRRWYAEIYEINETGTEDVKLLLELLGSKPQKVLEIACGGGRVLVPIARAGHEATGFDMDEYRLKYIQEKAKGTENLQYCYKDAMNSEWGSGYDVIVLAGNLLLNIVADIPYINAQEFFIQKAASSLEIGGYIFLDFGMFAHPEKIFSKDSGRTIFEGTDSSGVYGKQVVIGEGYDEKVQMAYGRRCTDLTLPDGQYETIHEKWEKHIPTLDQVHIWLNKSGFIVLSEFGDYNRKPINDNTRRAIIWAKKFN
jgi:SAM-dependent methyltransferase